MALLEVVNLRVCFEGRAGSLQAVDQVSFKLEEGETLGLVGESGSGKSVTALALMGLIPSPPGRIESGEVRLAGRNLLELSGRELQRVRGSELSMIFQDPTTSLNPFLTVGRQLTEVLEVHRGSSPAEARKASARSLGAVGIPDPEASLAKYPHQLSGGMRQRVMIAMALLCRPRVLLADEPTTALDPTIQAQILELMADLQERHGTAIVLITHDMGIVAGACDRLCVMYAGRLVETGGTRELFERPLHPYTRALLEGVAALAGEPGETLPTLPGRPPDLAALPEGCAFAPRCELCVPRCRRERPPLVLAQPAASAPPEPAVPAESAPGGRILLGGRRSACLRVSELVEPGPSPSPGEAP